jgi:hypothetical protein
MSHLQPSSRRFALHGIVLMALHFALILLVGFFLFSRYGFTHPPIRNLYEGALGAGVIWLGLPDTVFGWLLNSALYGVAGAALLSLRHRSTSN